VSGVGRADQHHPFAEAIFGLLAVLLRRAPRDMILTSLATLSTLDRTGPRRITDLAAIEGIAQPSMTSLVANLERDGLAERRSDPNDKRVALVSITTKGLEYVRALRRMGTESLGRLIGKLSDTDTAALAGATEALVRLRELDDQERDPGQPGPASVRRSFTRQRRSNLGITQTTDRIVTDPTL
jgi:DNA-binding MarR family transcriptional regulator